MRKTISWARACEGVGGSIPLRAKRTRSRSILGGSVARNGGSRATRGAAPISAQRMTCAVGSPCMTRGSQQDVERNSPPSTALSS